MIPLAAFTAALAFTSPARDDGRKLVEDVCTYCHNLDRLRGKQLSRQEWSGLIKGMISEGAPVTDQEFSAILDYLEKNYGRTDARRMR
jgi:competence protein ComEA